MTSCTEQDQCIIHNDDTKTSPSQNEDHMVSQPHEVTPQPPSGEGAVQSGLDELSWPFHGEDDGGATTSFLALPPANPQPALSQFLPTPLPDLAFSQSSPFQFPLDPIPRVGARYPVTNGSSTWTPQNMVQYGMMSEEMCEAVASIIPDSTEENPTEEAFLRQDVAPQQTAQSRVDMYQPGSMTVFLEPLDQLREDVTVEGIDVCQILSSIEGEGQMVHSPSPTCTHPSSEHQFQTPFPGDVPEYGAPCRKDGAHSVSSIPVGKVVSLAVQGSCPMLPQACLPLIRPTPTLRVPPAPHGPAYNFLTGPCFSQFQAPCTVFPDSQPKMSPSQFAGMFWDAKSRRPCSCTKSQCLKLYCDCFASGYICSNCKCMNCYNNTEHDFERYQAIKTCLDRNPEAFRPKIGKGKQGEVKGRHNKGCNCKRSGCLKNYCECYEAKIMCSSICKCVSCRNYDESPERQTTVSASSMNTLDTGFYTTATWQINNTFVHNVPDIGRLKAWKQMGPPYG